MTDSVDVLRTPEAGGKVIRGGVVRALGYAGGLVVAGVTAVLLFRYLGVVDFGRYATVMALVGIVAGVTDAGLTAVGSRELSVAPGVERPRLLANLLSLRVATTLVGGAAAVAFAAVAGYGTTLVLGTVLAGLGVVLISIQTMMTLPLGVELKFARLTLFEVLKHVLTLVGVALLVVVGASLLPFFALHIGVGLAVLALTPLIVGRAAGLVPRLDRATARMLVLEALPLAVAVAMSVVYVRVLVILMSLLDPGVETGLFATSFRIFEVLLTAPTLLLTVALPVLAVAGHEDEERLRYALQRMTEVALVGSALLVLLIFVLAEAALVLLAGEEYREAAPVLRVQSIALIGVFLGQAWQLALIAVRAQRAITVANGVALVLVLALGLALIPPAGAVGAAWAAVGAEAALAALVVVFLGRARPGLVPDFRFVWRVAVAAGVAAATLALPGLGDWATAAVAGVVFVGAAFLTGAVPREVADALLVARRRVEGN